MKIVIDGAEYKMPALDGITYKEANMIKKLTGLRMGQYGDAFDEGDMDMIFALAVVAKKRQDGYVDEEAMYNLPITKIEIQVEDEDNATPEDDVNLGIEAEDGEKVKKSRQKKSKTPEESGLPS
jgi:hypothetical protein